MLDIQYLFRDLSRKIQKTFELNTCFRRGQNHLKYEYLQFLKDWENLDF